MQKTTTSKELTKLVPQARIFDSEYVGYMLQHVLESVPVKNFQEWPPWRTLVVATASQILDGLAKAGIPVHHFVLHAERDTLTQRIETDTVQTGARKWRLEHLDAYQDARAWLSREAKVVDTTGIAPTQVAHLIAANVG